MSPKDVPHINESPTLAARIKDLKPSYKAAIGITLLALLWMGSGLLTGGEDATAVTPPADSATAAQDLPRVRVASIVSEAHTPVISLLGRTQAGQAVSVRTEVTGRVTEVVAEKGQFVEAGALLVRIDPEDRSQLLDEARARLKQRQIAYESAKKLSKGGYSSQLNVAQAQADLEAARALVTRMERDLKNTEIRAPFAGVVDTLPVEEGDYFDKAGQVAARVLDLSSIKAVGQVTERDITHIQVGGLAQIRLPDGRELDGVVNYVGMSSAALTRTFPVEVTADVPGRDVPEGLTAEIHLPLDTVVAHHISPALLTLDDEGRIGVKTVNADNIVEFHTVELESDAIDGAWLTGLPREIRVITVGQEFVRVGVKVDPIAGELPTMHPEDVKGGESNTAQPEG